jgi:hypothetical protein
LRGSRDYFNAGLSLLARFLAAGTRGHLSFSDKQPLDGLPGLSTHREQYFRPDFSLAVLDGQQAILAHSNPARKFACAISNPRWPQTAASSIGL